MRVRAYAAARNNNKDPNPTATFWTCGFGSIRGPAKEKKVCLCAPREAFELTHPSCEAAHSFASSTFMPVSHEAPPPELRRAESKELRLSETRSRARFSSLDLPDSIAASTLGYEW